MYILCIGRVRVHQTGNEIECPVDTRRGSGGEGTGG